MSADPSLAKCPGRSRHALFAVAVIGLLVIGSRLAMLGADFPPIAASVSEYGDMGFCLRNVRSRLIDGDWAFSQSTVSLGSAFHSWLVFIAGSITGPTAGAVTAVSALAFLMLWLAAARRWNASLSPAVAAIGLFLLGAQHILFAYSFSWKQEMLMVSCSILGLLPLDRGDRRGIVASGIILSLAFLTKFSALGAIVAAVGALMIETVSFRQRLRNISLWISAFLFLPILSLLAARLLFNDAEWAGFSEWLIAIVSGRVAVDFSASDRLLNFFKMNIILRSLPEMTIGLGLAMPHLFRRETSRVHRALVILAAVHLAGPLLAPHYPLRWALPAAAAAVFLAVEGTSRIEWRPRLGGWIAGILLGQAAGFLMWRHGNGSSFVIVAAALAAFLLGGGLLTRLCPAPETMKRGLLVLLLISGVLHGVVAIRWIAGRRLDQAAASRAVATAMRKSEDEAVAPLSFIGWQVLWPTRLRVTNDPATARFVLWDSTVPDGYWTIPEGAVARVDSRIAFPALRVILYETPGPSRGTPVERP
jgi:hypothetical protein